MDLKDIKELIALIRDNELSEFEMEKEDFRIKIKAGADPVIAHAPIQYAPAPAIAAPAASPAAPASAAAPAEAKPAGREITSPMPGTFYTAAGPGASAFVEVGSEVTEDTVVCIIEAMKVMNEIKAETKGVITEICVENGKPVQYGTVLFRLK